MNDINKSTDNFDIAVIGMSCRFPGANNIEEFWHNLRNGVESITHFADEELLEAGVSQDYIDNPDYVKANPKVVAGFVRATIKGALDTIKDPDTAIKSVMSRNETGDPKIELDRLKMSLRDNFVTPWVKENGFGGVDMARLAKSIDQIAVTYDFKSRPKAEDIFTGQYLPPASERKL